MRWYWNTHSALVGTSTRATIFSMDDTHIGTSLDYESRKKQRLVDKQSSQGSSRMRRRFMLWGGVFVVLALVAWGMIRLSSDVVLPTKDGSLTVPVSQLDHETGPENAKITLVEYSDFQCPACAAFYPIVKQLLEEPELKDTIRFAYRSFPLTAIHKNAQLAAQAAESAAMQGKFWQFHDRLFEQQQSWAGLSETGARGVFLEHANAERLDVEKFKRDIDSSAVISRVKEQVASGVSAGVNSTPSFFVNGKKMPQPNSYDAFKQYVMNALNAN